MACQQKRNQADTVCLDRMIYLLHTNFMFNKFENIEHVDPNFLVLDNFRYQECSMFEIFHAYVRLDHSLALSQM